MENKEMIKQVLKQYMPNTGIDAEMIDNVIDIALRQKNSNELVQKLNDKINELHGKGYTKKQQIDILSVLMNK